MTDRDEDNGAWENTDENEALVVPIEDSLDLHTFAPGEVKVLLAEYFQACREKNILEVRVIHGKGTGRLKATVESFLAQYEGHDGYWTAPPDRGGWGATVVRLKPPDRRRRED
ncbi:MAG: Smr/MutS family protein [Thermodesulfobacteriota bacterium]